MVAGLFLLCQKELAMWLLGILISDFFLFFPPSSSSFPPSFRLVFSSLLFLGPAMKDA